MSDVRSHLRSSVAASAAPYGYTLTIFSTGAVAEHLIGTPHVFEVLLFVTGAVLAFLAVEIMAYGKLIVRLQGGDTEATAVWGHAHLVSAGAAITVSWAFLQILHSGIGWLGVGFLATSVYLLLDAVQGTLAG